ncbi:hypothetical protein J7E67_26045 [Bacillus sp. ISL-46]|nr:hypothetical protein [Bacillus sp. ISL-46]
MNKNSRNGVIYKIPLGAATNIALFADMCPKIPVRYEIIGDVTSDIKTEVKHRNK